eukprot:9466260-Pyramimonas_sp.AAC.2
MGPSARAWGRLGQPKPSLQSQWPERQRRHRGGSASNNLPLSRGSAGKISSPSSAVAADASSDPRSI